MGKFKKWLAKKLLPKYFKTWEKENTYIPTPSILKEIQILGVEYEENPLFIRLPLKEIQWRLYKELYESIITRSNITIYKNIKGNKVYKMRIYMLDMSDEDLS